MIKLVSAHLQGLVSQHIVSQLEVEHLGSHGEGDGVAPSEVVLKQHSSHSGLTLRDTG